MVYKLNIDSKIESIGSRSGATVHEDACSLALFMRLSKEALSSPLKCPAKH
jgi:hypothetical protein